VQPDSCVRSGAAPDRVAYGVHRAITRGKRGYARDGRADQQLLGWESVYAVVGHVIGIAVKCKRAPIIFLSFPLDDRRTGRRG
jgi:hypothetical protein